MSIITHECTLCPYTTSRRYNLERHMSVVHNCHLANLDIDGPKVNTNGPKVNTNGPKVNTNGPKVNTCGPKVNIVIDADNKTYYKCSDCYKRFIHKKSLYIHMPKCEKINDELECPTCNLILSCKQSLSRHKKTCIKKKEIVTDLSIPSSETSGPNAVFHTIGEHNTISNTQTQNNTINILAFPNGMQDENFAFVKDHITPAIFASIMKKKPEQAFANYIGTLMQKEENRMIKKNSPNVNYCTVHTGENQWDLILDNDAIPVLAHHVTRSSFEDILKNKKKLGELQVDIEKLRKYIDDINTENDQNDNYNLSLQRTKLMLVNFTRKWGKDERDL